MIDNAPVGPTTDRTLSLGASEIGAVAGVNPYRTQLDIYAEKVGLVPAGIAGAAARVGQVLERPMLLHLYAEPRGFMLSFPGTLPDPTEDWITATPDALVIVDRNDKESRARAARGDAYLASLARGETPDGDVADILAQTRVSSGVEAKIVGGRAAKRWGAPDDGAEGLPPEVLCQVQWQMRVVPVPFVDVVALFGTDLGTYRVERDDAMIADLVTIGRNFWTRYVVPREMPPLDGSKNARDILQARYPAVRRPLEPMPEEATRLALLYDAARRAEEKAASEKETAAAELCRLIGDRRGFESEGTRVRCTWDNTKGSPDYRALAQRLGATPQAIEEARRPAHRTLRVTVDE